MALDLSRGLVPNLFLWFGQHDANYMPTDVVDTYNYPTIPLISTEPPCTPELSEDICDIRCPRDSSCRLKD